MNAFGRFAGIARKRHWMATVLTLVLVMMGNTPAEGYHDITVYCSSHPQWRASAEGCHKYAEIKRVFSGGTLTEVWWRGGTASGTCDPTNDVDRWRLESVYVIRVGDNKLRWQFGPSDWHSNCDVHAVGYMRTPNLTMNVDHHIYYDFRHQLENGTYFFPRAGFYIDL
jgi:hypothetical protein